MLSYYVVYLLSENYIQKHNKTQNILIKNFLVDFINICVDMNN